MEEQRDCVLCPNRHGVDNPLLGPRFSLDELYDVLQSCISTRPSARSADLVTAIQKLEGEIRGREEIEYLDDGEWSVVAPIADRGEMDV